MEAPPSLKLVILQGPRQGEILQYPPGSSIRIGRVARGNTLPIKDAGISSKHLSITTESGKWVLRDLDSSNGTVFDGNKIPPHTPYDLHDGATIKIGELTSIQVSLIPHEDTNNNNNNPKRNLSRRGRAEPVEPDSKVEGSDASVEPVAKPRRGRPAKGKGSKAMVNDGDEPGYVGQPANMRVTRNAKNKQCALEISNTIGGDLDDVEEKVEEPKKTRVTRNAKNKQSVIENSNSSGEDSDYVEEKVEEPKKTRVTRNPKKQENVIPISELGDPKEKVEEPKKTRVTRSSKNEESVIAISDSGDPKEKVEEPKKTRVTRNLKNKGSVIGDNPQNSNLDCGVEKVEGKKKRGGARKRNLQQECDKVAEFEESSKVDDEVELNHDKDFCAGVKETCDDGDDEREGEGCSSKEEENLSGNGKWPDLEKMSLGEWFDFLEVQLPKQVIDATEEMIDSMRHKAERLREYIIQQKDDKGKMPVS